MVGPGGVFCCLKKCRKSRDTVPFRAVNIPYRKYAGPTKIVRNFVWETCLKQRALSKQSEAELDPKEN